MRGVEISGRMPCHSVLAADRKWTSRAAAGVDHEGQAAKQGQKCCCQKHAFCSTCDTHMHILILQVLLLNERMMHSWR